MGRRTAGMGKCEGGERGERERGQKKRRWGGIYGRVEREEGVGEGRGPLPQTLGIP
jgi:hypothetical protein